MSLNSIIQSILTEPCIEPTLTLENMGITPHWSVNDNHIQIEMVAGFPVGWLEKNWLPELIGKFREALPDYQVHIELKSNIRIHRTQMPGKGLRGVKNIIAIASGKGGVGKSTVTTNLAIALSVMGARTGILDADIYGPSIPLMLGKTEPVQIENNQYLPVSAHGIQAMSIGYLADENQALIWRGPMLAKSLLHMLDSTRWDDLDYLLIDLPPGTGDIQLSLVQKIPLTTAIVVTTPQQIATMDAHKALTLFEKTGIHVVGIIENMAVHTCSQCHHQETIFGSGGAKRLCDEKNCKLLGQLPLNKHIQEDCDRGHPTALDNNSTSDCFMKTALFAAIELAKRPLNYAAGFPDIHIEQRAT